MFRTTLALLISLDMLCITKFYTFAQENELSCVKKLNSLVEEYIMKAKSKKQFR